MHYSNDTYLLVFHAVEHPGYFFAIITNKAQ